MKRSADRFLTTHTGSLPRPEDLVRTMFAREEGVPVDAAALAARYPETNKDLAFVPCWPAIFRPDAP